MTTSRWLRSLIVLLLAAPLPLQGQSLPERTPEQLRALQQAHRGDFDYLLGDWEFTSVHQEFGTAHGVWSAVKLAEGDQVYDEYRLVGDSGETWYVTTTLRAYNAVLDQWELVSVEAGHGLKNLGTARKVGAEMHIEQRFGVMTPAPTLWRIRYHDIRPDRFSWTADVSKDDGRSWIPKFLTIEARRIGPARLQARLTPIRRPAGVAAD